MKLKIMYFLLNTICMPYKYLKDKDNIEELHHHVIFSWWGVISLLSKWIPIITIVIIPWNYSMIELILFNTDTKGVM